MVPRTMEELERYSPLLASITRDIGTTWRALMNTRLEVETLDRLVDASDSVALRDRQFDLGVELGRLIDKANAYAGEIEGLGGEVEDFGSGTLRFLVQQGGLKYLSRWHVDTGFVTNRLRHDSVTS